MAPAQQKQPTTLREDVLAGLLARQAQMQFAYEDRIAELRARIDRFSSRQVIDQEEYDKKLEQILRRQAALESRAGALNGLGDATASIKQPARGSLSGALRAILPKSIRDKRALAVPPDGATIDSRTGILAKTADAIVAENASARIDGLRTSLSLLGGIALIALFTTRGIPAQQPSAPPNSESGA